MKPQKSIGILAILFCLISTINAQDLRLSSGSKIKTFKTGTYIEVTIPATGIAPCEKCSHNVLSGKLVSYQNGVVTMIQYDKKEVLVNDGKTLGFRQTKYTEEMPLSSIEIPKGDILSVKQSGKKKLKDMTTGQTIATCLGLLGLGHLASIPFAGENGDLLAAVGAAEVVVALAIGVSSTPKTHVTNVKCPGQGKYPEKIWMLE
jgi:hypothetical protein